MRQQTTYITTGKRKKTITILILVALLIAIAGVTVRIITAQPRFVPPGFDKTAQEGLPSPDENMNYGSMDVPTGFSFGLCGTMYQQEDSSLIVYFTNPETNDVNMKLEIKDEKGELLYESGAIKPGQYIEKLEPKMEIENKAMPIELSIYAYAPDTWYSMGTVSLNNTLQAY